jgi:hypothetical protein
LEILRRDVIRPADQFQPISGEHRDQPRLAVFLVRDDWGLFPAIGDRLFDRVEDVEILNALHFEMERRQFRTNHVGIPRSTAILLPPKCLEKSGLAELIPPKPFDALALLSRVHGSALPNRPCAQRTISSSA